MRAARCGHALACRVLDAGVHSLCGYLALAFALNGFKLHPVIVGLFATSVVYLYCVLGYLCIVLDASVTLVFWTSGAIAMAIMLGTPSTGGVFTQGAGEPLTCSCAAVAAATLCRSRATTGSAGYGPHVLPRHDVDVSTEVSVLPVLSRAC